MKKIIFTAFLLCLALPSLALADGLFLTSTSCLTNLAAISYSSSLPFTVGDADRTITDTCTSGTPAITTNDAAKCTIVGSSPYTLHAVGAGSCVAYNNCPSGSGYCTGEADQTITVSAAQSFAHVADNHANSYVSNPATIQLTGVSAGNLIAIWVEWANASGTPAITDGNGTDNAAFVNGVKSFQTNYGQWFYLLSSTATGTVTYTFTLAGATGINLSAWAFSHTAACTLDTHHEATGTGTANPNSGNITTANNVELVLGGVGNNSYSTITSPLINGSTPTSTIGGGNSSSSYVITSSSFANGSYATTLATSFWVCNIIAFK